MDCGNNYVKWPSCYESNIVNDCINSKTNKMGNINFITENSSIRLDNIDYCQDVSIESDPDQGIMIKLYSSKGNVASLMENLPHLIHRDYLVLMGKNYVSLTSKPNKGLVNPPA